MTILGIAWYIKEQWPDFQRVSEDKVEDTWEKWVENANRTITEMKKKGITIQKIPVDVMELQLWCRAKGRPCDSAARSEYVTLKLKSP